ncbi:hypothetical protein ACFC34_00425 [Streptomyces sp. NPDC056053]|uniref:hypothetical protein n=1 Tax=Streptomyces sp. NPDC056053 TaxID=3345696 RepID=UPI0035D873BE
MPPIAILMLHSALLGALAATAINAVWLVTTGHAASPITTLIVGEAVWIAASTYRALRARQQRKALEAAYQMPAFGDGFEPPHWPPADPDKS